MQENPEVECYTARVFTNNSVLIKKPAWPFSPLGERDQYARSFNASAVAAMDTAIHEYAPNRQARKFKSILLVFKNRGEKRELQLSSKEIYSDSGEDEELELQMMKLTHSCPGGGVNEEGWGIFQVANLNINPEKRGRLQIQKKTKTASFFLGSGSVEGDSNMTG